MYMYIYVCIYMCIYMYVYVYLQQSKGETLQFLPQRSSTSIMRIVLTASEWWVALRSGCPSRLV